MVDRSHFSQDGSDGTLREQDAENGIAQQPHHSVGFWHHKMSKVRKHVLRMWAQTGT